MVFFIFNKKNILFSLILILISIRIVFAGAGDPPNFQPELTIKYLDTVTNKNITLRNCIPGKTYYVPSDVTLTLIIDAANTGDNPSGESASVDIWYDWPTRSTPKDDSAADIECIPENPDDCQTVMKKLKVDYLYNGKEGKGVYNVVVWADRFDTLTELDEKDNFLGPIKIIAVPTVQNKQESLQIYTPTRKTLKKKY